MFEDYKVGQPRIYEYLLNTITNGRISHAYLFDTTNLKDKIKFAKEFAKMLICSKHHFNYEQCGECNICKKIDNNNFSEVKIIEPDGLWIKKEQILELQQEFSKKAVESNIKVYIIYKCERLNKQAANSMLKFLEEPEENIVAILLTDNINQVLPTIISRCQILNFEKNKIIDNEKINNSKVKIYETLFLDIENSEIDINRIDDIINFAMILEKEKAKILLSIKDLWQDKFVNKNEINFAFDVLLLFYKDILNYIYGREIILFNDYISNIESVARVNNISKIINKIKILVDTKNMINTNVNSDLLIDKLVIKMAEVS